MNTWNEVITDARREGLERGFIAGFFKAMELVQEEGLLADDFSEEVYAKVLNSADKKAADYLIVGGY